tara:strand:+ start:2790 stop:3392 length:603 start_codon:yes stop_codon:yes gene_type:complete
MTKSWIIKQHRDSFFKKSKVLGYRSRSAFKLIELNQKFKFFKNKINLLDLGSSPGGWSQVASNFLKKGKILAVDIEPMERINNVSFLKGNFLTEDIKDKISKEFIGKIDVIISDMAAKTTGNKSLDCIRTNELCMEVINFSSEKLKNKGILVAKLFMGEDFLEVKKLAQNKFNKVQFFKPKSSRGESKETYIHCSTLNTL